jgi:hypothetical protein
MEVSGQLHDPAALLPGKGRPQSRSGRGGIIASAGNWTPVVQPLA